MIARFERRSSPSRNARGRCHTVITTARIAVVASGESRDCIPGRANPRQPGSSPRAPSVGSTTRSRNISRTVPAETVAVVPSSANASRCTATGTPIASAYQYQRTRHRTSRRPSSARPARPRLIGATISAATNGANAPNEPKGTKPQAMTKDRTKNVTRGWLRTAVTRSSSGQGSSTPRRRTPGPGSSRPRRAARRGRCTRPSRTRTRNSPARVSRRSRRTRPTTRPASPIVCQTVVITGHP